MTDIMTMWQESEPSYREWKLQQIAQESASRKPSAWKRVAVLAGVCAACFAPALAVAAGNGSLGSLGSPDPEPVRTVDEVAVVAPEAAPKAPESYTVPEVVVVAETPRKAKKSPRRGYRSCADQTTEIYGTNVRVCDVSRSPNGKAGVWKPVAKPSRLASRDLASPSGLLR